MRQRVIVPAGTRILLDQLRERLLAGFSIDTQRRKKLAPFGTQPVQISLGSHGALLVEQASSLANSHKRDACATSPAAVGKSRTPPPRLRPATRRSARSPRHRARRPPA